MKQPPPGTEERVAKMTFASIYPHYLAKVEKKGRTKKELHEVITWLTGYSEKKLKTIIDKEVTFDAFFEQYRIGLALDHAFRETLGGADCMRILIRDHFRYFIGLCQRVTFDIGGKANSFRLCS